MIAFDTNLLVRIMVEDDPMQAARVRSLLEKSAEQDESIFVSDIVLCELEWVLESAYGVPRRRICAAIGALLADSLFCFEDSGRVAEALNLYQLGKADLSDHLLGLTAEAAGTRTTYTFDRALGRDSRFTPA